jgi:aspartate/methionine/tyrosine aminotransferase
MSPLAVPTVMPVAATDGTCHRVAAAARMNEIRPFHVMQVLARAQAIEQSGRRVIHMEIGEPDFSAPPLVVEAGIRAIRAGDTAYTGSLGLPALREAISRHYAQHFGKTVSAGRIAVTSGASGALLLAIALHAEPGRDFLVPDPGYPGYRHLVRLLEARPRALPVSPEHAFQPTAADVDAAWTPGTAGLVIGSPSNPAGTLIGDDHLREIAALVERRSGVLIVDEIYQNLVYGRAPSTALGLPGETILVNSFSKYFCMTGWRLGWAVLPEERIPLFERLAQHLFICPPTPSQHAALAAFEPESLAIFEKRRAEFGSRRDFLVPRLRTLGFGIPAEPNGAFYVYANCSAFGLDSSTFCMRLLDEEGIAATPGLDFGDGGTDGWIRFAYTRPRTELEEGIAGIKRFVERLR